MFKKIYKEIKRYDKIVIARHIGVDPDALSSQLGLRDSIKKTFPEKEVYAVGSGSNKFSYIGKLDKSSDLGDLSETLLIVTDTPDKKRVDIENIDEYDFVIKIDHHVFIEEFGDLEYIDDKASSACEIILSLIEETKLECDSLIAQTLYTGLVADSNRFLFNTCTPATFALVSRFLEKYPFNLQEVYSKMYLRPVNEVKFEGFLAQSMFITENKLGYVKITEKNLEEFKVDTAAAGNMINNFNFIDEILVWATITEDTKNEQIRVSVRSRGPEINKVLEKFKGGGHKMAAGAKVKDFDTAMEIMNKLDRELVNYNKG